MFYETLKKVYILILCEVFISCPVVFYHTVVCVISDTVVHDVADSIFWLIFCLLLSVVERDTEMSGYNCEFVSCKSSEFFLFIF